MTSTHQARPDAWERVRDDYLCGATAAQACARHGVSRSQLYARAKAEGWRRADRAEAADPPATEAELAALPVPPIRDLMETAWRRAALAIRRGALSEAQGWTRLAVELRRLAQAAETGVDWRTGVVRPRTSRFEMTNVAPDSPAPSPQESPESERAEVADGEREFSPQPDETVRPAPEAESGAASPPQALEMSWPDYRALCRRLAVERPDEPWWAEGAQAGPDLDTQPDPEGSG